MNKRKVLKRLNNPRRRDRILNEFNQSTLEPVGPFAGDKDEKFLSELNEIADLKRDAGKVSPDR